MTRIYRAFLGLTFIIAGAATSSPAQAVKLDVDFSTFAFDSANSLLEIYLAVGSNTLEYQQDSTGLLAFLPLYATLDHATVTNLLEGPADPIWSDSTLLQFSIPDSSTIAEGQHFLHQIRASVPPGEYVLEMTVPPVGNRTQIQSIKRDVLVPDYSGESVSISDITFATSVTKSVDRNDQFYKNGLSIRPNAHVLFGSNLPTVYYYFETYNAAAEDESTYNVYAFISQSSLPQPVPDLERRTVREARTPDAVVGGFDVSTLSSGSYMLNVVLLDEQNRSLAEQKRKFFVYNPGVAATRSTAAVDLAYETSLYASMTEDELDEQIDYARIIATDREDDALKSARNLDAKRDALLDFWTKRDPDPTTPINETREEYFSRIQYTRERYSNSHSEGWQTDRGRIYLKYGVPAHVNPHHYERNMAPYEIWEYDNIPGEGRSMFVFADVSGFSEFELIHSNVTGERKSMNWEQELRER